MPPSDAGGGDGGSFFAGHQAATDNGSSSDSRLSFIVWGGGHALRKFSWRKSTRAKGLN